MPVPRTLRATVGWAFPAQVAWALLALAWSVMGTLRMARGIPGPGQTAWLITAALLLAGVVALAVALRRWPVVYVLLSTAGGLAALAAAIYAVTADPALWSSEPWRRAGAALNAGGFVAAAFAVRAFIRWEPVR